MGKRKKKKVETKDFIPSITIFFDGACAPFNPGGHMGLGCVVQEGKQVVYEYAGYVEQNINNSNNVAEYLALENALDFVLENGYQDDTIFVRGDSKLVINQMIGSWNIKEGKYVDVALRCLEKKKQIKNIRFQWNLREFNKRADELSNVEFIKRGIKLFDKETVFTTSSKEPNTMVMPFGMHGGKLIKDCPIEYLQWAIANFTWTFSNKNLKSAMIFHLNEFKNSDNHKLRK